VLQPVVVLKVVQVVKDLSYQLCKRSLHIRRV